MKLRSVLIIIIVSIILISTSVVGLGLIQWSYYRSLKNAVVDLQQEIENIELTLREHYLPERNLNQQSGESLILELKPSLLKHRSFLQEWNIDFTIFSKDAVLFSVGDISEEPPEVTTAWNRNLSYILKRESGSLFLRVASVFLVDYGDFIINLRKDVGYLNGEYTQRVKILFVFEALFLLLFIPVLVVLGRKITNPLEELVLQMNSFNENRVMPNNVRSGIYEIQNIESHFYQFAGTITDNISTVKQDNLRKEEFLHQIDHELNTPLTTITGYASHLLNCEYDKELFSKGLNNIIAASKKIIEVKSELQNLYLPEQTATWSPFSIDTVLESVEHQLQFEIEAKEIEISYGVDQLLLFGQQELIITLIKNILQNSVKASPYKGRIIIETGKAGEAGFLTIRDSGSGMNAEQLRIYNDIQCRGKHSGHLDYSHGKGLDICKEILSYHKCGWVLENTEASGLSVRIDFTNILQKH